MWTVLDNELTLLLDQSRCLSIDYVVEQGQEFTLEQSVARLCDTVNRFEAAVNTIGLYQQEILKEISQTSDYEVLLSNLQAIGRADASWRRLQTQLLPVKEEYERIIACNLLSATDLEPAVVNQLSRCLDNLMQTMHNYRSPLRERINALTRSSIRPLHILDLPDELLMLIFGHVKDYHQGALCENSLSFPDNNRPPTCDISNIRLSCRRFYNTSSHLLMDFVRLELQPDSLSRLQEISRHPLIRKGIRSVHVSLGFYHSELANDLQHFALWCHKQFRKDTDDVRLALKFLDCDETTRNKLNDDLFKKARDIQQTWGKACLEALQDQQRLLASEEFAQDVAAALAQMPVLKSLNFGEQCCYRDPSLSYPWCDFIDEPTKIESILDLEPEPPINIVVDILGALPAFTTGVESVSVLINGAANTSLLVPGPQLHEKLNSLAKQLSHISVSVFASRLGSGEAPNAPGTMADNIYPFLSAILDTDSLEEICLNLDKFGPISRSFGPILNCQTRTKLRSLELYDVSIHEHEMRRFANSLTSRRYSADERVGVVLEQPHLLSGSWICSVKPLCHNPNVDLRIHDPSGKDCEYVDGLCCH
ncbi:hypothetical protein GGR58DRAFT_513427 [Xylaria digitata]|nr:hypothetical protein GGR58DRAFT_513427 [Xylaria digitata]